MTGPSHSRSWPLALRLPPNSIELGIFVYRVEVDLDTNGGEPQDAVTFDNFVRPTTSTFLRCSASPGDHSVRVRESKAGASGSRPSVPATAVKRWMTAGRGIETSPCSKAT